MIFITHPLIEALLYKIPSREKKLMRTLSVNAPTPQYLVKVPVHRIG